MMRFADHHIFSSTDLEDIKKNFQKLSSNNKIILTTEKDAVRLQKFEAQLCHYPIYALPTTIPFMRCQFSIKFCLINKKLLPKCSQASFILLKRGMVNFFIIPVLFNHSYKS